MGQKSFSCRTKATSTTYIWRKREFSRPNIAFKDVTPEPADTLPTVLNYFSNFITSDIIQMILDQKNLYSAQETGK